MDFRQTRYFLELAKQGNYLRASEILGISESALSQSIMKLEAELGHSLFERGRFGARLTEAGEILLTRAKSATTELELAKLELSQLKGGAIGHVTLGINKSLASDFGYSLVDQFSRRFPKINLTIVEDWPRELCDLVMQGEIELAVTQPPPQMALPPTIVAEPLFWIRQIPMICERHPLWRHSAITFEELARHRWVLPPVGNWWKRVIEAAFVEAGVEPPQKIIRTNSLSIALRLLTAGQVVGFAPLVPLPQGFKFDTGFRFIELPGLSREWQVQLFRRSRSKPQMPLVRLMNTIRNTVKRFKIDPVTHRPLMPADVD
ncbi:MAG: LysR family transcriptional regulator [Rhodospirillaceae bacterium]|nr:LysR family transcriptional regulator [Rhodospirillaceae bacterium]